MSESLKLQNNLYWDQSSIKHDLIKVRSTQNLSSDAVGYMNVIYDVVDYNIGNSFALVGGVVKVLNNNIHHVKVTSVTWVERGGESYAWIYNIKNGQNIGCYMLAKCNNGSKWQSVTISSICDVKKDDILGVTIYFNVGNNDNQTSGGTYYNSVYLIIEAID